MKILQTMILQVCILIISYIAIDISSFLSLSAGSNFIAILDGDNQPIKDEEVEM